MHQKSEIYDLFLVLSQYRLSKLIISIDLGKHCFHAVAHNYAGKAVLREKSQPTPLLLIL